MLLIDLTLPVTDGMAAYPGDPPVRIRPIHNLAAQGWRLSEVSLGSHTGTHVNAPWHMAGEGARLEELELGCFVGRAAVRRPCDGDIPQGVGLIYADAPLDENELPLVLAARPPFVAQAVEFPLDEAVERELCRAGLVSFENLANTAMLPRGEVFLFMGLPLPLSGDGAPARAVAMLDFPATSPEHAGTGQG